MINTSPFTDTNDEDETIIINNKHIQFGRKVRNNIGVQNEWAPIIYLHSHFANNETHHCLPDELTMLPFLVLSLLDTRTISDIKMDRIIYNKFHIF